MQIWKNIKSILLACLKKISLGPFQLLVSMNSNRDNHSIEIKVEEDQNEH